MTAGHTFLAVDLGASSGRVMAGRWTSAGFSLHEVHRFPNDAVRLGNSLHWDVLAIWSGILDALKKFRVQFAETPAGIGVDAWGVDFGLLDREGRLLGNPYHYRDVRTLGVMERVAGQVDGYSFFLQTGVQPMPINTVYQLVSMIEADDSQLHAASSLLTIPDLFQYFLCRQIHAEFTEATTTQLCDPASRSWSKHILDALQIRSDLFAPIRMPATVLGPVQPSVLREGGFDASFPAIAVASHDTSSAVAAIPGMDEQSAFLSCGTWSLMGARVYSALRSRAAYDLGFSNEGAADGAMLCIRNLTGLWILQECMHHWEAQGKNHPWEQLLQAAEVVQPLRSLIDTEDAAFQAPGDMPSAIRAWCAQTDQPLPDSEAEIVRSVLESLALRYGATFRALQSAIPRSLNVVRLVGGGVRNRLLCQMTADACRRPVVAGPVEAAALGNLLAQAAATGHLSSLAQGADALSAAENLLVYQPQCPDRWQQAAEHLARIQSLRDTSLSDREKI